MVVASSSRRRLLRDRFGRDNTVFQTAWLYEYDVGKEMR